MRLGLEAGENTLDLAAELGIAGVPISAEALVDEGVEATLAPLRDRGLAVCQIGAFGFNPLSTDVETQRVQERILREAIPLATAAGCPYLVVCPGNYHPSGFMQTDPRNHTAGAIDELARGLAPLVELAEQHGARISIEPYLKGVINSPARFGALKQRVASDALRINVDPSSLYDYADLLDPRAKVQEVCSSLAGDYGLVHIKEVALSEGFHIHAGLVPLGEGPTDWEQVLRLIGPNVPEDSWVILEHVQTAEEARASVALLRSAAARVGVELS
jgi:sugar phosphate isomerase/epimerase